MGLFMFLFFSQTGQATTYSLSLFYYFRPLKPLADSGQISEETRIRPDKCEPIQCQHPGIRGILTLWSESGGCVAVCVFGFLVVLLWCFIKCDLPIIHLTWPTEATHLIHFIGQSDTP